MNHFRKNEHCSEGFNTHLWAFSGDRRKNIHFESKPRHVTPQIDHFGITSPVLRDSTHIYGVSQEIDEKTFIFQGKPRHVTPQIDCFGKTISVLRVSTNIYGVSKEHRWENIHFESKPRPVTPQIDHLGK